MNVIAGVDGSKKSLEALSLAAKILDPEYDSITVYHHPPRVYVSNEERMVPSITAEMRDSYLSAVFSRSAEALPLEFRESMKTLVGEKKPAAGILAAAEKLKAGLIVMGADTKSMTFTTFLGAIARKVVRRASVPVLVYRPSKTNFYPARRLKILMAHDGSQAATQAASQLGKFHWPAGSTAHVLRVLEWPAMSQAYSELSQGYSNDLHIMLTEAKAKATNQLARLQSRLPLILRNGDVEAREGEVVETICGYINEHHVDVLVVAPHNKSLIQRVIGSTTESLLHYAPCSVMVCHGARDGMW